MSVLSTQAHITPRSFVNEHCSGDLCGDSKHLVKRYDLKVGQRRKPALLERLSAAWL